MIVAEKATKAKRESKHVDFKEEVDVTSSGAWCELIKDLVALANSGGGVILVGVSNDGTPSDWDPKPLLDLDPAKIIDKVASYTGRQFDQFDVRRATRSGRSIAVITVGAVDTPMVFERPGTYDIGGGKQRTAFGQGTLFFRHGAKSEPAKYADVIEAVNRSVERRRRLWFKGIRRVIEAEPGDTIQVVRPPATGTEPPLRGRIVDDKNAVPVRPEEADSVWPYRQSDVVRKVNGALAGQAKITSYDLQAVRKQYEIGAKHPEFTYRPFAKGSAQYSEAFVEWLLDQHRKDPSFFRKARQHMADHP